MPAHPREELEEMWSRWVEANRIAEEKRDWTGMVDLYAEDASYGWMYAPDIHFMAVGRDQIRDWALGEEMLGFEGWHYPYQARVIDDQTGMIVGFWRQLADVTDPDSGQPYEMIGLGGSWFGYAGNYQWAWQRDFFDVSSAGATMMKMAADGNVSDTMARRFEVAPGQGRGHYALADLPATMWPPTLDPPF